MLIQEQNNPFQYLSPERIEAQLAVKMFVDVFKDYYQVQNIGNTFIHGARGSGKSMMFRIMKPDCQKIIHNKELSKIPFYAIYVPVKDTSLNISELSILTERHGGIILNEHILCLYVATCIFDALSKENFSEFDNCKSDVYKIYSDTISVIKKSGHIDITSEIYGDDKTINDYFKSLNDICSELNINFRIEYLTKLMFSSESLNYNGPLCLYVNFLSPIIKKIRSLEFMPTSPLYLLVDDADELNETQTKILNTWVSYRTTEDICFKISTQQRYITYFTTKGSRIDSPHDYFEITLNQIYTSESKERYLSNVKEIVEKRLKLSNIDKTAEAFFPSNVTQEQAIKLLHEKIKEEKVQDPNFKGDAYDYAYRNARPDYMTKELSNKYTYSYAGFAQMVHLSSGIIRHFLDLASKMYTTASKKNKIVGEISVNIQDEEIKKYSEYFFMSEFEKAFSDRTIVQDSEELDNHKKLRNLIEAVGKSFRIILKSNSSERRKFSFYFDGDLLDGDVKILKLGEKYGYFHGASLGSKSGLGRSKLYVLNRMLAPYYKLDPFSFSGYLYLTAEMIHLGMTYPNTFIKKIESREYHADEDEKEITQLVIDFENDN